MSELRRQVTTDMLVDLAAVFAARNARDPDDQVPIRNSIIHDLVSAASALNPTVPQADLVRRVGVVAARNPNASIDQAVTLMSVIDTKVAGCPEGLTLPEREMVRQAVFGIAQRMVSPDALAELKAKLPPMVV